MYALLLVSWLAGAQVQGKTMSVPDVAFAVAYRQRSGKHLSQSVHLADFSCIDGACELTTLTLNQCLGEEYTLGFRTNRGTFYPKVQRASTKLADLKVEAAGFGVIVAEWLLPADETSITHRFAFADVKGASGRTHLKLTGFSGAAVKVSATLGKTISWELEPFRGAGPVLELDCPVLLDGVE